MSDKNKKMISHKMWRLFMGFFKKYGLKLWIALALLAITGLVVYASYPGQQNKAKKVISTAADAQMKFSSNYMEAGSAKFKTIALSADDPTIGVTVRNFSKTNPTVWYTSDINYTLSVELTNTSGILSTEPGYSAAISSILGNKNVIISIGEGEEIVTKALNTSNMTDVFNGTLGYLKNKSSSDEYTIEFPDVATKICVRLIATPTPSANYPDLSPISVVLSSTDKDNLQSDGWEGSFNDSQSRSPSDFDAYNYVINGYGDSDTATFSWNSDKIEINRQYFESKLGANMTSGVTSETRSDGTWNTVTIHLNSETSKGRYDFQIFRKYDEEATEQISFETWAELENCVEFDDGI